MTNSLVKWDAYLQIASQSDVGMRRTNNQDNFFISLASTMDQWQRRGHLFIVADGMGAHAAGELASKIAIDQIPHLYAKFGTNNPAESLHRAIADANAEIHRRGQANEEFHNMGTTCSAMLLLPEGIVCGHVGDSRVYRVRKQRIDQLTFDHSLVWEMRAAGQLNNENDAIKIPKNVITRSLGPYPEIRIDLEGPFPVEMGDVYMLCSDGLTGQVSDQELGVILSNLEPAAASQLLVDISNLRGGPDNITLIVVKVVNSELMNSSAHRQRTNDREGYLVHPFSWVALIISLLVAGIFYWSTRSIPGAIVPLAISVISLIWICVQLVLGFNRGSVESAFSRYGRGPYTKEDFEAAGWPLIKNIKEMIQQISVAGQNSNFNLDQNQYKALRTEAEQAEAKKNLPQSIRSYGQMITFLMAQFRNSSIQK